jgi:hypothetical protein
MTQPEHEEQPMPTPNDKPSIQSMVRHDLEERERVGVQRYGTPLQAGNGRDALRDAYEEALDLACYLKQAIVERDGDMRIRDCDGDVWIKRSDGLFDLQGGTVTHLHREREWIERNYGPVTPA